MVHLDKDGRSEFDRLSRVVKDINDSYSAANTGPLFEDGNVYFYTLCLCEFAEVICCRCSGRASPWFKLATPQVQAMLIHPSRRTMASFVMRFIYPDADIPLARFMRS